MTISNYVMPSAPMNEDVSSEHEQEQEAVLEETLDGQPMEELTDQDDTGSDQGSGEGSGQGNSETEISTSATGGVANSNEATTIPSTFFSAMAYSIEAYLEAIEAQQVSALMNIELYVEQVQQQHDVAVMLAKTIRQKFKLEADEILADAVMSFISAGLSAGQMAGQTISTRGIADQIQSAHTKRTNLLSNYNGITPQVTAINGTGTPPVALGPNALNNARKAGGEYPHAVDANGRPVYEVDIQGRQRVDANGKPIPVYVDKHHNLNQGQRNKLASMLKDDINAVDHEIAALNATRQHYNSMWQIGSEIVKSTAQGAVGVIKSGIRNKIGDVEFNRSIYENIKELISSLIQQIQGRISSSSKSSLDGIDTLRNAIRQFQG